MVSNLTYVITKFSQFIIKQRMVRENYPRFDDLIVSMNEIFFFKYTYYTVNILEQESGII